MKRSDEAVEKVLDGLRGVEVPQGLERRVLRAAVDRADGCSRSPWRRGKEMTPALLCGVALALAGFFGVRHRLESGRNRPRIEVARSSPAAGWQQVVPPVTRPRVETSARPARKRVKLEQGEWRGDAVALAEIRAPSMVAPPLPLTRQEEMLVRIARQGNPEELALLNPEMRLRHDAQGVEEFERFFGPTRLKTNQKP